MSVVDFLTKKFPTDDSAVAFFVEKRWGNTIECAYCKHDVVYRVSGKQPYKCASCKLRFTAKTGTIMEGSPVSVRMWLFAMYLMGTSRKGISSLQLAKHIGVTQKTAWYMAHRIREACEHSMKLRGIVEVDEVYIGGLEKNKHAKLRQYFGRGVANKIPVMGLHERGGRTIARVVNTTSARTLQGIITKNVAPKSAIFSDDHTSYSGLADKGYAHHVVKHSHGEYVDGNANTNSIESFWAVLRRGLYGTYHSVSKKHLQRYVNEFAFRAGYLTSVSFIDAVCSESNGRAVRYTNLIA